MNIVLKQFQETASDSVLKYLHDTAPAIINAGTTVSVILSAPTGSGKTMMITDVIEKIIEGYDDKPGDPEATFLWLTDQPQLNEQTKRKMVATSSVLGPGLLITIEPDDFDQETFTPGAVYFLNIQKMRRDVNLVKKGDGRTYTIWETVSNTIRKNASKFHLILDEAHRGLGSAAGDRAQAETIVQKFIKGSPGEIPAIPLIIGVSATPGRFQALIAGTSRASLPVDVDPSDVRSSGLIKDVVRFKIPKEEVPSDVTLLRGAVARWKEYGAAWKTYCDIEGIPLVRPLLIVQVRDGDATHVSKTNLDDVINTIKDAAPGLGETAFAHSFDEGTSLKIAGQAVRYIKPSDITDDPAIEVVLFKMNLSTGWDCPRAEVMMSFRTAADPTHIAQLVGRMVRTPLARRIDTNDMLNSVTLVLPHYDAEELKNVVRHLKAADPDEMPPTDIEDDDDIVDVRKAAGMDECFVVAGTIPSYVIPAKTRMSQIRRLMKMARLLTDTETSEDALDEAVECITSILKKEYADCKDSDEFKAAVRSVEGVETEERVFNFTDDLSDIPDVTWIAADASDIEKRFGEIGRRVGEGFHKKFWRDMASQSKDVATAKIETIALLHRPGILSRLNDAANAKTNAWIAQFRPKYAKFADEARETWNEVVGASKDPVENTLNLIDTISVRKGSTPKQWIKHLYADERGNFEATLNKPETDAVTAEIGRADVIAWYRNLPRKPYSLCVPYKDRDGAWAGLYPDFVIFCQAATDILVDIIDPHLVSLDDASYKAAGLAQYVEKHPNCFSRVLITRADPTNTKSLDLADPAVRTQVLRVRDNAHLISLYDTLGV